MAKEQSKFYIIGERYNPQLGTYLYGIYNGNKKTNKRSITCKFMNYGFETSLRFTLESNLTGIHYCLSKDNSIYGSVSYYGFDTVEQAKKYLDDNWAGKRGYESAIAELTRG